MRLYTLHEGGPEPRAAVLFIHGLDGDPHETWNVFPQSQRTFWPLWLKETLPDLAVHTIEYEAAKSKWRDGHALAIDERAMSLKNFLATELKPGKRLHRLPLAFITHSMGGLITKSMLRSCSENPNRGPDDLLEQTCGVVFMATPHAGSDLAWWARITGIFSRPTTAVRDMMPNDPHLLKLNAWYRNYAEGYGIRSYAFYETKGFKVVEAASADPAIQGLKATPVDADHIQMAKPINETAQQYVETVDFLRETLNRLGDKSAANAASYMPRDQSADDDAGLQGRYGYRAKRENAFPACADLHVEARQGTDRTKISAIATLRCRRERLRGHDGRVFWLSAQSLSMTLHADSGEVSAERSLGDDDPPGEFNLKRGPHNVIVISKRGGNHLEGLALDEHLLPAVHATRDQDCSLEVQIGAFPEELNIDIVFDDEEMRLQHLSTLRRRLMKIVVGKALDRVDDRVILSRAYLWPEDPR